MDREVTAWQVICVLHGPVCLTSEEYDSQMMRPNATWHCPVCGQNAQWDDEHHDSFLEHGSDFADVDDILERDFS